MRLIRAVIFDLGKVLIWFDNKIFLRKLADRAGLDVEKLRAAVHENLDSSGPSTAAKSGPLSAIERHVPPRPSFRALT